MAQPHRLAGPIDGRALFNDIVAPAALMAGWERVAHNGGAAGGDGMGCAAFAVGAAQRVASLASALRDGSYRPGPLRIAAIEKPHGGTRKLTIPCVRDRVAQTAAAQALGPKLDAEMEDSSYAYRAGRSVAQAVARVESLRREGYVYALDADIDDFFDTIPIDALLARFSASVSDGPLTDLLALWLEQAAVKGRGIAQGSPLSPLLANLYLDALDEELSKGGLRIVRYADDFIVLAKSRPAIEAALGRTQSLLAGHGLRLDSDKTAIKDYGQTLHFLGHIFVRGWAMKQAKGDDDDLPHALARLAQDDENRAGAAAQAQAADDGERVAGLDRAMRVLHVRQKGRRLALRNQSFAVFEAPLEGGADGPELVAIHASRIDRIEIGPEVDVGMPALRHALASDIPVAFIDGHGRTLGQLAGALADRAGRHLAQARHALDPALRLDLAKIIVAGRLANERALLRRVNHRRGVEFVSRAAAIVGRSLDRSAIATSIEQAMGFEAVGTKTFWKAWGRLLLNGFAFPGRHRRASADAVNIALDLASWLLMRDVGAVATAAGLHPGFGMLHATADRRDACVYDLIEEFRAGLLESLVLGAVNTGALRLEMYATTPDGGLRLGREGSNALVRAYEERCERAVTSVRSGKRVSWRRLMREQAEAYGAHVEGKGRYRPYVLDH